MIRPLRQRHRLAFIGLGVFLPVIFAVGIIARKPLPVMAGLPAPVMGTSRFEAVIWDRAGLFPKVPVKTALLRESTGAGHAVVKLAAPKDFVKPDLLVYWAVSVANPADGLPADAVLLGAFGAALPLPDAALKSGGSLVLYSLADNEIVDVSRSITPADLTR